MIKSLTKIIALFEREIAKFEEALKVVDPSRINDLKSRMKVAVMKARIAGIIEGQRAMLNMLDALTTNEGYCKTNDNCALCDSPSITDQPEEGDEMYCCSDRNLTAGEVNDGPEPCALSQIWLTETEWKKLCQK